MKPYLKPLSDLKPDVVIELRNWFSLQQTTFQIQRHTVNQFLYIKNQSVSKKDIPDIV